MKNFTVNVTVKFTGQVTIKADSFSDALEVLDRDFGITIGDIETTNDDQVVDWDFDVHPENYTFEKQ